jgi:hypothetical protein
MRNIWSSELREMEEQTTRGQLCRLLMFEASCDVLLQGRVVRG